MSKKSNDTNEIWNKFKICITEGAKKALGAVKVNVNEKKHYKQWLTNDVK